MTHPRKKIFQEPMCIDSDSLVFENDSFFGSMETIFF